ncbi:MAG: tetratricopeptide repeat protein [Elusimicrobia bacterium]|nr:tetratricopeptide repeat protein [Elusimicrobiota bacterium]
MIRALLLALICALPARAYDTVRFLEPVRDSSMKEPVAVAAGVSRIYALDGDKDTLLVYDLSGRLLKTVVDSFHHPKGVAVGPQGSVFVADAGNDRIAVLDEGGRWLSAFGAKGSEPGRLSGPESVAVGADGRVYVADTGNNRVQVFTKDGILLFQFGGKGKEPGQFRGPTRIAVDPTDNVYVLDGGNDRIQKFDASARLTKEFHPTGDDFAVDSYGFLYVLRAGDGKIEELDAQGHVLGRFGSKGSGVGQFKKPEGLALAPDGRLLVADKGNLRIDVVEIANKLKTQLLPPNLETKISVSGPSRTWSVSALGLAPLGDSLYAYLSDAGLFVRLDEQGKEKARFGTKEGKDPSVTHGTRGFAASQKLGLYVSDTPGNRVQHFTLDGTWKANLAESSGFFDSKKKEGRVRDPRGIAINDEGTIYVADAGNRRIDAFSPEGGFLFGIGPSNVGSYDLQEPVALAWDKKGFLYFADRGLKKVFKTEPSGALIAAWGEEGSGPGQFKDPAALAFDGNNYLYVLDVDLKRVSVYSKDGRWMTDLFSGGKQDNELDEPSALAVHGNKLVIADPGKGKISVFDLHPSLAAPVGISTTAKEGLVAISWTPVSDPWLARYRVYRSTQSWGPYEEAGKSEAPRFEDDSVLPEQKYFYRVSAEARTGDVGPAGAPVEVSVGAFMNRAPVELSSVTIGNIFSANYKWYLKNPVGRAVVVNNVNAPFQNVKLTFRLKDFMDFGYDQEIKRLEPHQTVELPLIATLNNKVLEVSEDTPVQAEFSLTYFEGGKEQRVSRTLPLRVYSRNAITWDTPERIANFVTPKDPPVLDYAREVLRQAPKDPKAEPLNANIVVAAQLWDALAESGLKFFANPSNPYEKVSEDQNFPVDYTQFPRDTLKRKNGQCDDLTTLLVSLLDGAKVPAAILDYPGHMALIFDTGAEDPAEAGLPAEDLVAHEGTYWVPLEATLAGKPFLEAVRKAAYAYHAQAEKGKARIIEVRRAWETFEPATLPAQERDAEVPSVEARQKRFSEDAAALSAERHKFLRRYYEGLFKESPDDMDLRVQWGMIVFQDGEKEKAVAEFEKVLAADPKNASALNDLGNVAFLSGDFAGAEQRYLKSAEAEPKDVGIWMNLVKTAAHLNDKSRAAEYGKKAVALEASLSPAVDTLVGGIK